MFKEQKLCKSIENKFIFIFSLIFIGYNCEMINCKIIKLIQILIVFINLILEIEESSINHNEEDNGKIFIFFDQRK